MSKVKLINIVGARPQIIKASAICRAIRNNHPEKIEEILLHTGQHYDKEMSDLFFDELQIRQPDYNLGVGSSSHGKQTALMISGIEEVIQKEKPNGIIIYGDTNSTLAGAIAASKLHIPVIHIEAGLRSFNKLMPEEVNRIISDHVSTLLFAPTILAQQNLVMEGFKTDNSPPYSICNPGVILCGDIMYDNSSFFAAIAEQKKQSLLHNLSLEDSKFVLVTIHRDSNTDNVENLEAILRSILSLADDFSIRFVIPFHPRTLSVLRKNLDFLLSDLQKNPCIIIIPPASFLEMIMLEKNCTMIITDSGGVQKESHFFKKPCIVLRKETEWVELIENGTAKLVGNDPFLMREAFMSFLSPEIVYEFPDFYGNGNSAGIIMAEILQLFEPS